MSAQPRTRDAVPATGSVPPPIAVDLDGTLTCSDTLAESLVRVSRDAPLRLLSLLPHLMRGRAAFKEAVAAHARVNPATLPYREPLLAYLREQRTQGRSIVLATAAHVSIARDVADHLRLFDDVLATEGGRNLKGRDKLQACRERFPDGFVYAGDGRADLAVWAGAQGAILVGVDHRTAQAVGRAVDIEHQFPRQRPTLLDWLRTLRIHQWLKNLLLFVPLLTSFRFTEAALLHTTVLAFVAFSLVASATYVLNDLWDLENDRAHARKRERAFASGRIPIVHGIAAAVFALALGFGLALTLVPGFGAMLLAYLVLTVSYSRALKRHVLVDVIILSLLYTMRVLAGSVAIGVATSSWLLALCAFAFLSLALAKRCSELVLVASAGKHATRGRDYRVSDLAVLQPMGLAAAMASVVVFGLFISAPETQARYATPQLLWLVAFAMTYWLGRLWIKTSRGEIVDDPLVYALTDRSSLLAVVAMVVTVLGAHYVDLGLWR
jgi:4-hydroxybenzoate polyprenyltransferase